MKKSENAIREFVSKLNDENLKFLYSRLYYQLSGDLAEVLNFISKSDLDRHFNFVKNSDEFHETLEVLFKFVDKECNRKFVLAEIY